jgi:hypothetical protein
MASDEDYTGELPVKVITVELSMAVSVSADQHMISALLPILLNKSHSRSY